MPLLRKAGLPYRTLHALRHTAATLMLEQEVPVHVVAGLLGQLVILLLWLLITGRRLLVQ